jgi:hypothetical protein
MRTPSPAITTAQSAPIDPLEWMALAAGLTLLAAVALRPSIRGNDGVGNYVYLASVLRGGDLDFTDEYREFDALKQYAYKFSELPVSPATGRPSDRYGVGASILWAPFVAPVHVWLRWVRPAAATGLTRPYEWAVGLGSVFWGSLGLLLLYGRLRREHERLVAGGVVAGLVLATPLGFYMYAHGSMSHGVGFFAAVGALLAFERSWRQPSPGRLAWLGFWAAGLVTIRFQDATWALLLLGMAAWRAWWARDDFSLDAPKVRPSAAVGSMAGVALVTFSPQLIAWKILYGSFLSGPMPYLDSTAGSFSAWPSHLAQALFSARHGALGWHPLLVAGLVGLALELRRGPEFHVTAALGLVGFAALAWLVGCWSMWWAGASFGNRFFIGALPWLALGMAEMGSLGATRVWRTLCAAALGVLIVWNFGLLYQYATEMIPREDPTTWERIVKQNVVDVPADLIGRLIRVARASRP